MCGFYFPGFSAFVHVNQKNFLIFGLLYFLFDLFIFHSTWNFVDIVFCCDNFLSETLYWPGFRVKKLNRTVYMKQNTWNLILLSSSQLWICVWFLCSTQCTGLALVEAYQKSKNRKNPAWLVVGLLSIMSTFGIDCLYKSCFFSVSLFLHCIRLVYVAYSVCIENISVVRWMKRIISETVCVMASLRSDFQKVSSR